MDGTRLHSPPSTADLETFLKRVLDNLSLSLFAPWSSMPAHEILQFNFIQRDACVLVSRIDLKELETRFRRVTDVILGLTNPPLARIDGFFTRSTPSISIVNSTIFRLYWFCMELMMCVQCTWSILGDRLASLIQHLLRYGLRNSLDTISSTNAGEHTDPRSIERLLAPATVCCYYSST